MISPASLQISVDEVGAFLWMTMELVARASVCAAASVADAASLFDWYELDTSTRARLAMVIHNAVERSASDQRMDWRRLQELPVGSFTR